MSALAVVIVLSAYFPYLTYALPAMAGLCIMVVLIEINAKWAFLTYISSALISFFIAESEAKLLFICIFGYYPILKSIIEKLRNNVLEWIMKIIYFNAVIILVYSVLSKLFIISKEEFAILGNYIDFSALQGQVSFEELDSLLDRAEEMTPAGDGYAKLRADLAAGKKLLYLTDNAGEIGFDRIFAEVIQKQYPQLGITFCVRGGPAMNDALRADAELMEIPFPVIDNGNRVAGTQLDQLSEDAKQALDGADVIIAKGQGNVETMYGCGYNVYYAFLIKCERFVAEFGQPKLTPMLLREQK